MPKFDEMGNILTTQPDAAKNFITFAFVGLEVFTGIILAVLLIFFSVEKTVGRKQAIIKARQGAEFTEELPALFEKEEAAWLKEKTEGEAYYQKIQTELAGK